MTQPPEVLYKYHALDLAVKVLESGSRWWSARGILNDPDEFRIVPVFRPSVRDSIAEWLRVLRDSLAHPNLIDADRLSPWSVEWLARIRYAVAGNRERELLVALNATPRKDDVHVLTQLIRRLSVKLDFDRLCVYCMSDQPDSAQLWQRYGGDGSGCVFGFVTRQSGSNPLRLAQRVQYVEHAPVLGSGLEYLLYANEDEFGGAMRNALFYTKWSSWSCESEWRGLGRLRPADVTHKVDAFDVSDLVEVRVGRNVRVEDVKRIERLAYTHYPRVRVLMMSHESS